MASVGAHLASVYPDTNTGVTPYVQTFTEFFIGPDAVVVYGSLWVGVGVLLVITCANIVNLLLARAAGRTREVGVRLALGAGRTRIIRLQVIESLMLAAGGALFSWWLSPILLRAYAAVALPPTQPWAAQLLDYSLDWRVFTYLLAIATAIGIVTGALPALRLPMLSVQGILRDGDRGAVGAVRQRRIANAIVVIQVGLAVVLLTAAGVLLRSLYNVHYRPLGYDPTKVLASLSSLPASAYPDVDAQFRFFDRALEGVNRIPGIEAVALIDGIAGQGSGTIGIEIEGQPASAASDRRQARQSSISGGYFAAMGTAITLGRDFDERDNATSAPVAIVNRRFAQLHWSSDDVLGKRLRVVTPTTRGPWLTVIGVAPDLHQGDRARADVDPTIYRPFRQRPARAAWMLARTSSAEPRSLIPAMRREVQSADPDVPVWLGPYTLDEWNAGSYWKRGVNGGLFAAFALVALLLASLGLFAVMLASVAERRHELSVRMALGANAGDVLRMVIRQGLVASVLGLSTGLAASLATNQLLATQLVGVAPWDPGSIVVVASLIVLATLAGCVLPALRAILIDPVSALRGE
jgi:putative ABC transport system permease protein